MARSISATDSAEPEAAAPALSTRPRAASATPRGRSNRIPSSSLAEKAIFDSMPEAMNHVITATGTKKAKAVKRSLVDMRSLNLYVFIVLSL